MTNKQALEIAELLKLGKQYKQGHYSCGYDYFWFVESSNTFIYKNEDLVMNIFKPTITEVELSEKDFLEKLISDYKYTDLIENIF